MCIQLYYKNYLLKIIIIIIKYKNKNKNLLKNIEIYIKKN